MAYFGYTLSTYGKAVAFKAAEMPFISTKLRGDAPDYPLHQVHAITDAEFGLSIDQLKKLYPFEPPKVPSV